MAVAKLLLLHVLLIVSSIGSAVPSGQLGSNSLGCVVSSNVPADGSSQTFDAVTTNGCSVSAWEISGSQGVPFALIFSDLALTEGDILHININAIESQSCTQYSSCPAILVQPIPNGPSTVSLTLQTQQPSTSTKYFSFVAASVGTRVSNARSSDHDERRRSHCDGEMPAWGTVLIVFIVFFFLTIMCCTMVRCCQRKCPRSGQIVASASVGKGASAAFQEPSAIVTPPPAYPQVFHQPENILNDKFEMYKSNKH